MYNTKPTYVVHSSVIYMCIVRGTVVRGMVTILVRLYHVHIMYLFLYVSYQSVLSMFYVRPMYF